MEGGVWCPECDSPVALNWSYCPYCGAELDIMKAFIVVGDTGTETVKKIEKEK